LLHQHIPTACETEPFLSPGSIQPHGYLLTLNPTNEQLLQLSVNCVDLLGAELETCVGCPLHEVLPEAVPLWQRAAATWPQPYYQRLQLSVGGVPQPFWASFHQQDGVAVLELEPCLLDDAALVEELQTARAIMARLYALEDTQAIADELVRSLRAWSGFEQVVLYRFIENGSGQVIAESRIAEMPSYQGLFFPASDVPYQVRAHASRKTLRMLADTHAAPVPLQPPHNPLTEQPLNQTSSELRTPHYWGAQYYRNMAAGAVLSVSMVQQGRLLGYVCFHHREPRLVDYQRRAEIGQLVEQATYWLCLHEDRLREQRYQQRRSLLDNWLVRLLSTPWSDWVSTPVMAEAPALMDASGFAVGTKGHWHTVGDTPELAFLDTLSGWLNGRLVPEYLSHRLADDYPPASQYLASAAGLVALSPGQVCDDWLL